MNMSCAIFKSFVQLTTCLLYSYISLAYKDLQILEKFCFFSQQYIIFFNLSLSHSLFLSLSLSLTLLC